MQLTRVAWISACGMTLTAGSVYALTEPTRHNSVSTGVESTPQESSESAEIEERGPATDFETEKGLRVRGRVGHAVMHSDQDTNYVLVEVDAPAGARADHRAPTALSIAIDRSGSMVGGRLDHAKQAALGAVSRLADGDVVSVVAFDVRADVVVPPTVVDAASRAHIESQVNALLPAGETCLSCGLEDALSSLSGQRDGRVSSVLVLSDGNANVGTVLPAGFMAIAERAMRDDVELNTVGLGLSYNEKTLAALSDASNGRHFFVEQEQQLASVFAAEAEQMKQTVAMKAEVGIRLAPGVRLVKVHDRFFERRGDELVVPLGALGAGQRKTVLIEVALDDATQREIASVETRYHDLVTDEDQQHGGALAAQRTDDRAAASPLDPVVLTRIRSGESAALIREAHDLVYQGKFAQAQDLLKKHEQRLDNALGEAERDADRGAELAVALKEQKNALSGANSVISKSKPMQLGGAAPAPLNRSQKQLFDLADPWAD